MNAEVISIGNELLNGNTVNTNATFIARRLHEAGVTVQYVQTLRDDADDIRSALKTALERVQVILLTGGLGPTHDDITKKVLSDYFNTPLVFDEKIFNQVKDRFESRGLTMPDINRSQAYVPKNTDLIPNPVGTAPGMIFRPAGKFVFVMPGVPREMTTMVEESIIPLLQSECPECRVQVDLFRTTGIPESAIYEKIEKEMNKFSSYEIAFLPRFIGVDIRVIRSLEELQDEKKFDRFKKMLYHHIGRHIYTTENQELEAVLGRILTERKETLAVAESLTGGMVQDRITHISGSSAYYLGGIVAYSNEAKMQFLQVEKTSLEKYGAVSEQVAEEMARGVQKAFETDLAISTTGIAGPTGATETKPVGLAYTAVLYHDIMKVKKLQYGKERDINKLRTAQAALELARQVLLFQ